MGALLHFHDHLDLDDRAAWQRRDAEGGAGVATAVAEDTHEQIGAAIDHGRLCLEVVNRVHEAADFYDAFHLREVANLFLERGEESEGGGARGGVGEFFVGVLADFTGDDFAVGVERQMAGEEDQIAAAHSGHVIRDGRIRDGQRETEGGEFRLGCGRRGLGAEWGERKGDEEESGDEGAAHGGGTLNL